MCEPAARCTAVGVPPSDPDAFAAYLKRRGARGRESCSSVATRTERSPACSTSARSSTGRSAAPTSATTRSSRSPAGVHARRPRALLRYAFGTLGLHRLEANIQPENSASIALARRCGFRREGFSPRYLKIGGRWRDHERWAILAEDPRAAPGEGPRPRTCRVSPSGRCTGHRPGDLLCPAGRGRRRIVTRQQDTTDHAGRLAAGTFAERVPHPGLLSEGPVRFLLVCGDRDDRAWGWSGRSGLDRRERGGFLVSPRAHLARQRDGP